MLITGSAEIPKWNHLRDDLGDKCYWHLIWQIVGRGKVNNLNNKTLGLDLWLYKFT